MSQYNLNNYKLISTISFEKLTNKDQKNINLAFNKSQESDFTNSYKIGACISSSKGCVCCG
jgi:hypothetical protein